MDINLENLQENKNLCNACMKDIMEKRSNLMKQEGELEEKKDLLVDDDEIARIDNEKAKIAHEINSLTTLFENSKLELEIIQLQEELLKNMITETEYNNSVAEIAKQREQLGVFVKTEEKPILNDELTTDKKTESFRQRIKFELTTQIHARILENYKKTDKEFAKKSKENPKDVGTEINDIA